MGNKHWGTWGNRGPFVDRQLGYQVRKNPGNFRKKTRTKKIIIISKGEPIHSRRSGEGTMERRVVRDDDVRRMLCASTRMTANQQATSRPKPTLARPGATPHAGETTIQGRFHVVIGCGSPFKRIADCPERSRSGSGKSDPRCSPVHESTLIAIRS